MDDQTRFWIAQQVADTKYTSNIQPLFRDAKQIAGKRPNTVITDGAANFHDAFKKEFFTLKDPRTRHISHIRLQGDRWKGGINNYVDWMLERLKHCYRVLKDTATMFLHCDHHASQE
jgi:DNA modification methylase